MKKGAKKKSSSDRTILITTTLIITLVAISPLIFTLTTPIFFSGGFIVDEPPECSDGLDNDLDGGKDFNDGDCDASCDDGSFCEFDSQCSEVPGSGLCNLVCDDVCVNEDESHDDECPADHVVFRLTSKFNAHAGIYRAGEPTFYYPYSICRQFTMDTSTTCDGTNMVLRLSAEDDAHVEKKTANAYVDTGTDVCYGSFECVYADTCDTANEFFCIATIAPSDPDNSDTNMMVSTACEGAGAFDQKICCKDNSQISANSEIKNDIDEDPSEPNNQVPQGLTHTLFFEESSIEGNVEDCEWSVVANGGSSEIIDTCNGANPTVPEQVITFDGPIGDTYVYTLTVETNVETKSTTIDLIEIIPPAECGNGVTEHYGDIGGPQYERCDDGNSINGDGCSSICQPELGYKCSVHRPSVCSPICGDGYLVGDELDLDLRCDNGKQCNNGDSCNSHLDCLPAQGDCRTRNNDGCDTECFVEPNWKCTADIPSDPSAFDTRNNDRITGRAASARSSLNKNAAPSPSEPPGPSECSGICEDGIIVGEEQCEFQFQCSITQQPCNPDDESSCFGGTCEQVVIYLNEDTECSDLPEFNHGIVGCNLEGEENECQYDTTGCTICGDNVCDVPYESQTSCNLPDPTWCYEDCGGETCSLLPGTEITLANKNTKVVENIVIGDAVLSYNVKTGLFEKAEVVKTVTHPIKGYYLINGKLQITGTNAIFVNQEWIYPAEIKVGDTLVTKSPNKFSNQAKTVTVNSIEFIDERATVYTLTVDNMHNFLAENILVHNKHCGIGPGFCEDFGKDACEINECCHFVDDASSPNDGTCVPDTEF